MTMYWKSGQMVRFIGCDQTQIVFGGNDNPNPLLKIGEIYELSDVEVHSWNTKIQIKGIKGKFNSVCFELLR